MTRHHNTAPAYLVDDTVFRPFAEHDTVFSRRFWDEDTPFYDQDIHDRIHEIVSNNPLDGYSRLEYSALRAAWTVAECFEGAYRWEYLGDRAPGLDRLERLAVPDVAVLAERVKGVARSYGADLVGLARLDRRWLYAEIPGSARDLPPGAVWAIVIAIRMDAQAHRRSPDYVSGTATGVGYSRMAFAAACLSQFIRNLGYDAYPMGNDTALSIPLAIDAGLGQLGRNGLLLTQEYGACVRLCKVITDIPLVADTPSETGLHRACRNCTLCAEACKARAISRAPDPSYDIVCCSNNPGIMRWAVDHDRCYSFWVENGASCANCIAACPLTATGRER